VTAPVHTGVLALADLGDGCLTLVHGGAGPADSDDPRTDTERRLRLEHLAAHMGRPAGPGLGSLLHGHARAMSPPERVALCAARALEGDPLFNAGRGAALQEDGAARVSAGFMESRRQKLSAVVNVEGILHPSELAWLLQSERFSVLDAAGASRLADRPGVRRRNLVTEARRRKWERQQATGAGGRSGTIGCVSGSARGDLASVTSTGGVGNETVGRIGDTPGIAGTWCDGRTAVSCTGQGEQIVNLGLAHRIGLRVQDGAGLEAALRRSLAEARLRAFQVAAIAVHFDPGAGRIEWAAGGTADLFLWSRAAVNGVGGGG